MGKIKEEKDVLIPDLHGVMPQKKHKKHKHKKHKKKKASLDEECFINVMEPIEDEKSTFKVKFKKEEERSAEKTKVVKAMIANIATTSALTSPKSTVKKKMPKSSKSGLRRDSGTSSEEERWLDAIESGKLEEVTLGLEIAKFQQKFQKISIYLSTKIVYFMPKKKKCKIDEGECAFRGEAEKYKA